MPIRFACEYCGVRLSVSSRKAGREAKCPKCERTLTIPKPVGVPIVSSSEDSQGPDHDAAADEDSLDPFAQFLVFDDDSELIYGGDSDGEATRPTRVDPRKVAVPRSVLYMQGILLGIVGLFCFTLGLIVAGGSGDDLVGTDLPEPCLVTGRVALGGGGLTTSPDAGAVAIIVPQDVHPEKKAEILGLRPGDMAPTADHQGLAAIRSIGGDYARADQEGRFQLRVPDTGHYFVLFISAGSTQSSTDPPNEVLAQIGRFFALTPDFFDGHDYRWQAETIRRDRELNIVF